MSEVTLSLKLQTVLNYLDEIDDIFSQLSSVEKALRFQEKVNEIRHDTKNEIKRLDNIAIAKYQLEGK